jgi:RNA recognition motif-containing protein
VKILKRVNNVNLEARNADTMEIPDGCTTVFIRNLPYDITEEELGSKFRSCGDIKGIRLVYNSTHSHFKGFGYVQFENTEGVSNALNLNDKPIKGRKMIVDFEQGGPKAGFKFRSQAPSNFNKEYNDVVINSLNKKRHRK